MLGGGGGGTGGGTNEGNASDEVTPSYTSTVPPPQYEADSSEYHSLDPHQSPYMESSPELYSGHPPPPLFEHKYHHFTSQYAKTYPHPTRGKHSQQAQHFVCTNPHVCIISVHAYEHNNISHSFKPTWK